MAEENIRLTNIGGTRKSFIEKINKTGLMSKKHKLIWTLSYEYLLILASAVTQHISVAAFAYLVGMPIGITNSVLQLKCLFNKCDIQKELANN